MTKRAPHGLHEQPAPSVLETAAALRKVLGNGGLGQLEFEVRLGTLDSLKRFLSNVPEAKADKLVQFFESHGTGWEATQSHTRETCWGGSNGRLNTESSRHIVDLLKPSASPLGMIKSRVANINEPGPPALRFSIALERSIEPPKSLPAINTVRIKKRSSYSNGTFRVDITRVASHEDDRFACEVEVELVDKTIFFRKTVESVVADILSLARDLSSMM